MPEIEISDLQIDVTKACKTLSNHGLVILSEGNVSAINTSRDIVVIKASGQPCHEADTAVVTLSGLVPLSIKKPSVDTVWHCGLYEAIPTLMSIAHTHSPYATAFAQAGHTIPMLGTTHADAFGACVEVTEAVEAPSYDEYNARLTLSIIACYRPSVPAILLAGHGVVAFGSTPHEAADNAVLVEKVARLAYMTMVIHSFNFKVPEISSSVQRLHWQRKHGTDAFYGQV